MLNELAERGYVRETDDGYRLTALGEYVYDQYARCTEGLDAVAPVAAFLSRIPGGVLDVDLDRFADGRVTTATEGGSYAPLDRTLELRRTASRIRELAPGVERRSVEQLARRVETGEDLDVEIVLTRAALDTAESQEQYAPGHAVVADAVDLYLAPEQFELPVGVVDETVTLVAGGLDGHPDAVLETDDPVVREWAHSYIDRSVELSEPLDP